MPKAASKRQYRMMMAILHGKKLKDHPRGRPPKSIAAKYDKPEGGAPESRDNDRGGSWKNKDKKKKDVKKTFEQFYRGKGAGVIVLDKKGRILVGECKEWGRLSTPGGHVDPGEDFLEAAHRETREEAGIVCQDLQEVGSFRCGLNDSKKTSLKYLVTKEKLEKNILRGPNGRDAVYDVSHGDALRLVGNGAFRMLREAVSDMKDEDFKDIILDGYVLSIRKHLNDMYSGRVSDGHKVIHQFSHKSLPALTADIMSVFEWYLPEDEPELQILGEENLPDDVIAGGLELCEDAGNELQLLESKLLELQNKVEEMHSGPATVEAFSANPANPDKVYNNEYMYLPRPQVTIEPSGKIKITFGDEWNQYDKENFLKDLRAKAVKDK
jgi:8-oxo-dGTP pyrophosphatase MutT (NUDIX family)